MSGLLTTNEVAAHVRRTPDTVRRWAKRGILRSAGRLPDGGWLFRIEDVEELLGMKRRNDNAEVLAARINAAIHKARAGWG